MTNNYVLLITGCIHPNSDVPFLKVKNAEDRRKQYIESILFYIKKTKAVNIVYCDNSSSELPEELRETAKQYNKVLECLSFQGDVEKTAAQGKGYGEGEIIEYALRNSEPLRNAEYFIKVTGRVIIKNFDFILKHMKNDRMYFYRIKQNVIDTKFYGIPIAAYKKHFLNLYHSVNDVQHKYIEHLFSDKIHQSNLKINRFVVYPNAMGICGSNGRLYNVSLIKRIKRTIKIWLLN